MEWDDSCPTASVSSPRPKVRYVAWIGGILSGHGKTEYFATQAAAKLAAQNHERNARLDQEPNGD